MELVSTNVVTATTASLSLSGTVQGITTMSFTVTCGGTDQV